MALHAGRVVIITGAGGGVGRAYALEFARQGAKLVINDLGGKSDGTGSSSSAADAVVDEIRAMGGEAVANYGSVASWEDGAAMVKQAVDTFGDLHAVVCNAGILRDKTLVNMSESEWDAIMQVHLKGTFVPCRHAAAYWRDQSRKGKTEHRAIITTSSVVGLFGNYGQSNYAPAKAHLAMMAQVMAAELARFNVTVNSICPWAATRLTDPLAPKKVVEARNRRLAAGEFDAMDPQNCAASVVWLCSPEAKDVTGRVFLIQPDQLKNSTSVILCEGYTRGPTAVSVGKRFDAAGMGGKIRELIAGAKVPTFPETYEKTQADFKAKAQELQSKKSKL